jgi:hypothetical protein
MAFVYILRSGDEHLFKIGRTSGAVEARHRQLSTGNPHPLTPFDVIETDYASDCETYLHHRLRSKRSGRSDATEFFELDPTELAEVIRDARDFVADVLPKRAEAERLGNEQSDGRILQPGDDEWETYRRLLDVRQAEDVLGYDRERLENELKLAIGRAAGLANMATWKTQSARRFDEAAFKTEDPGVYERFVRETRYRVFRLL